MEIEKKNAADELRERLKKEHRQSELLAAKQYNYDMAQKKKEIERAQKESEINIRRRYQVEYDESINEEKRTKEMKKEKMNDLKKVLDDQVALRRSKIKNEQSLSTEEKQLNKVM